MHQHAEDVSVHVLFTGRQNGNHVEKPQRRNNRPVAFVSPIKRNTSERTHLEKEVSRKLSNTTEQKSSEPNSSDSRVRCPVSRCRKMSPKAMSL